MSFCRKSLINKCLLGVVCVAALTALSAALPLPMPESTLASTHEALATLASSADPG